MADKPVLYPQWASEDVQDPISQQWNVVEPPLEKKTDGWFLGEKPNRQWWNWFQRTVYDWIVWLDQQESQTVTTNAAGAGLFTTDNAIITLTAVDSTNPTRYIYAVGFKGAGVAPVLNIVNSNTLTLGAGTSSGNQPVSGGATTIITGTSRVIP